MDMVSSGRLRVAGGERESCTSSVTNLLAFFRRRCYILALTVLLTRLRASRPISDVYDWCNMDTGWVSLIDPVIHPDVDGETGDSGVGVPTYISRTRDGSVWIRFGVEHKSPDWTFVDESSRRFQTFLLDDDTMARLKRLNYSHWCVMTDVKMSVDSVSSWHPSFVRLFYPATKKTVTALTKHTKDCEAATIYRLSADRQRLSCQGVRTSTTSACGQRDLPKRDDVTNGTIFIREVNFDPRGSDYWNCQEPVPGLQSSFTFFGSYYHVYVKMSDCNPPTAWKWIGNEARLRPNHDSFNDTVIIPDPTQTVVSDGIIVAWQFYAKIVSLKYEIYLQVWRPVDKDGWSRTRSSAERRTSSVFNDNDMTSSGSNSHEYGQMAGMTGQDIHFDRPSTSFQLVGQKFYSAIELRLRQINLTEDEFIPVRAITTPHTTVRLPHEGALIAVETPMTNLKIPDAIVETAGGGAGDVLGLYIPNYNPIPWTAVPCASRQQLPMFVAGAGQSGIGSGPATRLHLEPGRTKLSFSRLRSTATADGHSDCRHYSLNAVFGKAASAKVIEDWQCPDSYTIGGLNRIEFNGGGPDVRSPSSPVVSGQKGVVVGPGGGGDDVEGSPTFNLYPDLSPPTVFVLIVIVCLILLLIIVGLVSYCVAVKL